MDLLQGLNASQKEAVLYNEGPLLVLAGAGSGKTKVITTKIAYLLKNKGVKPGNILAVTFTNKAANEMKERVSALTGRIRGLMVSTFHSFGVQFLKQEIESLGYLKQFSIYSANDSEALIKNILMEQGLDEDKYPSRLVQFLISKAKNQLESPEEAMSLSDPSFRTVYKLYTERLKALNAVDFDDLIFMPVKILQKSPEIKEKWAKKFEFLLVDEYQDTNHSQYILARLLSSFHQKICVVGDDDQSIYAFRGANVDNILRFTKDFSNAKTITLNINYRSTGIILDAAYALIHNNSKRHKKEVKSHLGGGEKIGLLEGSDAEEEAQMIAGEIFENRISFKIPYHQQVVLCRTNTQMRVFEEVFREKNIPYRLIGGYSFFERKEVRDVISYLKVIYNPLDNLSMLRIINFPKRGIGDKALEAIKNYSVENKISIFETLERSAKLDIVSKPLVHKLELLADVIKKYEETFKNQRLSQTLEELIKEMEFEQEYKRIYKDEKEAERRIESLLDLAGMAKNYEKSAKDKEEYAALEGFLDNLSLLNQDKEEDDEKRNLNKVVIMTIHAAKGLEFDAVFLPGFEEGFIPHDKSMMEGPHAIEEERRLAYVAITRAKKKLTVAYAMNRKFFGKDMPREVSRFLQEIPSSLFNSDAIALAQNEKTEEEISMAYLERMKKMLS